MLELVTNKLENLNSSPIGSIRPKEISSSFNINL